MSEHDRSGTSLPWLDDDAEPEQPGGQRRRRLLLVASLLPWVVVVALVVRPGAPVDDAPPASTGSAPTPAPSVAASTPWGDGEPSDAATSPRPDAASLLSSGGRLTPGAGDAAALATVAARAWLTEVGPSLEGAGADRQEDGTSYLEHVAVEAVDWPAPGAAVVSLLVVLLDVEDAAYRDVRARRLAVPVRLDADGATVAGEPWWLPDPDLTADELRASEPVDDPDLLAAAGRALDTAGVAGELVGLDRTEGWPWLATLRRADRTQVVWLRPHLGGFAVAGSLPGPPDDPGRPAPEPSPAATTEDGEVRS